MCIHRYIYICIQPKCRIYGRLMSWKKLNSVEFRSSHFTVSTMGLPQRIPQPSDHNKYFRYRPAVHDRSNAALVGFIWMVCSIRILLASPVHDGNSTMKQMKEYAIGFHKESYLK